MSELTRWSEGDPEWRELLRYTKAAATPASERVDALAARVVRELASAGSSDAATHGGVTLRMWIAGAALLAALSFGVLHVLEPAARAPALPTPTRRTPATAPPHAAEPAAVPREVAPRPELAPEPSAPSPRVRRARREPGRAQPATQVKAASPTAELELLKKARLALRADPAAALALVEQHAREHPAGIFAEEREALGVEALWRAGAAERAEQRLRTMLARYPRSTYRERLTELLAPTP